MGKAGAPEGVPAGQPLSKHPGDGRSDVPVDGFVGGVERAGDGAGADVHDDEVVLRPLVGLVPVVRVGNVDCSCCVVDLLEVELCAGEVDGLVEGLELVLGETAGGSAGRAGGGFDDDNFAVILLHSETSFSWMDGIGARGSPGHVLPVGEAFHAGR